MNHDLLDYLLKTLLDLPHSDRAPKKVRSVLQLAAEVVGMNKNDQPSDVQLMTARGAKDPSCTLIRMSEVTKIVGLARPTIYKLLRNPESKFPRPVKLTEATGKSAPVAWVLSEVQDWTRTRIRR